MIYTLTLSPSIDVYLELEELHLGKLNRTMSQGFQIGGKGINVSLALKSLGVSSIPIVVLGGFTGDYIEVILKENFEPIVFHSSSMSRMNIKVLSKEETEINGSTSLEEKCLKSIYSFVAGLREEDFLVVSGSAELESYQYLLKDLKCKLILDVRGDLLAKLMVLRPWLVKPNTEELLQLDCDENEAYLQLKKYTKLILHTDGRNGVKLITEDSIYSSSGINVPVKSTIGCGDATLAGFLVKYLESRDYQECLDFSNFCGAYRAKMGCFYAGDSNVKRFHIDKLNFR